MFYAKLVELLIFLKYSGRLGESLSRGNAKGGLAQPQLIS